MKSMKFMSLPIYAALLIGCALPPLPQYVPADLEKPSKSALTAASPERAGDIPFEHTVIPSYEDPGTFSLMSAVEKASPDIIALMIESGADIHARSADKRTVLMAAAQMTAYPEIISLLLDTGADASAVDDYGNTAFEYAKRNPSLRNSLDIIRLAALTGVEYEIDRTPFFYVQETAALMGLEIMVTGARWDPDSMHEASKKGYRLLLIDCIITNVSPSPFSISSADMFELIDEQFYASRLSETASAKGSVDGIVTRGRTRRGELAFEVDEGHSYWELVFRPDPNAAEEVFFVIFQRDITD